MKSRKSRHETAVQGTNDSSIVSKCSTAQRGYFCDAFLQAMVARTSRRAPLIHRGYYVRFMTVDRVCKSFLEAVQRLPSHRCQVLSLGAGFDTAFFRLSQQNLLGNCTFFEVDFQPVVHQKIGLLQQCENMWEMLHDPKFTDRVLMSTQYRLLSGNLENLAEVQKALDAAGIIWDLPTFILSECVLTYLPPKSSAAVLQWTVSQFTNAAFLLYEQVCPDDPFGDVMLKHFLALGSPILGIHSTPTLQAHTERFLQQGWTLCCAHTVADFYLSLSEGERKRIASLEPFDEWEEWHLKAQHYVAVTATSGQCCDFSCLLNHPECGHRSSCHSCKDVHLVDEPLSWQCCPISTEEDCSVQRFGHCSVQLPCGTVLILGGFGNERQHGRLSSIRCVRVESNSRNGPYALCKALPASGTLSDAVMFSSAVLLDSKHVMLFGGRSSPSKPTNATYIICLSDGKRRAEHGANRQCCHQSTDHADFAASTKDCMTPLTSESHSGAKETSNALQSSSTDGADSAQLTAANFCLADPGDQCVFPPKCLWTLANCSGERPAPCWRHSASIVHGCGAKYMVVFGGCTSGDKVTASCHRLSLDTLHWTKVSSPREPIARHSHSACVWRDHILVITGGLTSDERCLNDCWLLDLDSELPSWSELEVKLPKPIYSHTCCLVDDTLITVGGVTSTAGPPLVMAINLVSHLSFLCKANCKVEGSPVLLHNHTMHNLPNGQFLILGGGGNCFSFGTHFNLSPILLDINHMFK